MASETFNINIDDNNIIIIIIISSNIIVNIINIMINSIILGDLQHLHAVSLADGRHVAYTYTYT